MIDDGSFLFFTAKFLAIYVIILMGLLMVIDIQYTLKWYEYWIFGEDGIHKIQLEILFMRS